MRRLSPRRAPAPTSRLAAPLVGLALILALFVVACSAGSDSGSSSASGNGGNQSQTFATPPTIQTTPPVATAVGTQQPIVPGVPGLKPTLPGQIPAFTQDDMANFVLRHGFPNIGEDGTPSITQKIFIPNSEVEDLTGYTTGLQAATNVGYVELQGSFDFPTPPNVPPIHLSVAYMLFDTSTGDIIGWGGLPQPSNPNQPTPTPPAQPTATPVPQQPTATPVPQNPPVLTLRPSKTTAFCSQGGYPNDITVANTGGSTLTWSATGPSGITITPSSGSLSASTSQTVKLSGIVAGVASFTIHFTSNGGSADVTIECQ